MIKNIFKTRGLDRTDIIEFHDNTFILSIIPDEELKLSNNVSNMTKFDIVNDTDTQIQNVTIHREKLIDIYKKLLGHYKNIDILYHIYMQSIKVGNPPSKCKRLLRKYHTILISGSLTTDKLAFNLNISVFNLNILSKTLLTHLQSFEDNMHK